MFKIKTFNQISSKGLVRFPDSYEVGPEVAGEDAILVRSHKLQDSDACDTLRAVARAGAGVNNVPVASYTEKGIVVFNTPGANANAVKELVLCGLLLSSRGILPGMAYVNTLSDMDDNAAMSKLLEKEKSRFKGSEIAGKTLGIIGLGAIGSLVAEMAIGLGMQVLGYDPALSVDAAWRLPNQVRKIENLSALLANSDFVSLHLPVLESTRNLIDAAAVASMKPGLCLLNFSRDEIVNTQAIVDGLNQKQIRMYVADFPCKELIGRDDVILMPHIGASTDEAEENCAVMAADQLTDFLENGNIKNSVNFPNLALDRARDAEKGTRLAISNRNVPKMLGQILSVLADQNINVIDMINRSRNEIAYNLIDVESRPSDAALARIAEIQDVIKVTVL
ncbi:MAG: phosphoglycerate dehydrogenase [Pseudomonadales bacterium]|nr:phosphoglycerate dehydrogenase [Pseudomonadales bacterium]MCP5330867.1 phosphoglycerate dehydrogenase [Pseudomonadales bacterium]MCP5343247.1 phosphoglycerate dehydrogenase [Pseudomonadales bacterium]